MKNIIVVIALCTAAIFRANAQNTASNTRVQAQSNLMIVYYDLAERSDVQAYVSFDNGTIWQGPIQQSSGSVGNGVQPGKDKIIIWDSVEEIGSVQKDALIRVIATRVGGQRSPDVAAFLNGVIPGVTYPSPTVAVQAEPEPPPPAVAPPPSQRSVGEGNWLVIVGSFQTRARAEVFARQMEGEGLNCEIIDAGNQRYRIVAGRFSTQREAINRANELKPSRDGQVWITTE